MFLDFMVDKAAATLFNYEEVVEYLTKKRGLTVDEIKKYRLGYTIIPSLPMLKDDPDDDEFREETKGLYYLEKKLFIPLENSVGLVNGLITRSLEEETKYRYKQYYLREAKKIGAFFGLQQAFASILETGTVYVTEGAIDCISIARHYPNTVSTLTSFINDKQMYLLKMISDNIVILFDPDEPGREGVQSVLNKYGSKGIYHREFGNKDANAYLVKYGDAQFKKQLERSLGSLFLI